MKKKTATRAKDGFRQGPWLEQQLIDSRVIAGSKLEQLIKQNPDFTIFDPGELTDGGPFPLSAPGVRAEGSSGDQVLWWKDRISTPLQGTAVLHDSSPGPPPGYAHGGATKSSPKKT